MASTCSSITASISTASSPRVSRWRSCVLVGEHARTRAGSSMSKRPIGAGSSSVRTGMCIRRGPRRTTKPNCGWRRSVGPTCRSRTATGPTSRRVTVSDEPTSAVSSPRFSGAPMRCSTGTSESSRRRSSGVVMSASTIRVDHVGGIPVRMRSQRSTPPWPVCARRPPIAAGQAGIGFVRYRGSCARVFLPVWWCADGPNRSMRGGRDGSAVRRSRCCRCI